jgi:hypothetical protein
MIGDLRRALGDLRTPRFLLLSLLPLAVVLVLATIAVASLSSGAGDLWGGTAGDGNWLADWVATWPYVGGVAGYGWVRGILGLVGAVAGWLLALLAGLFFAVAVVGLLTPSIVGEVGRRHYPNRRLSGGGGVAGYLRFMLRTLLVFIGLGLLVLPLLFVPGLNALAINLPFFYWFHRLLTFDVLDTVCSPAERATATRSCRAGLLARTALLYPLSLVPLVGLLLQVLFVLVLAHYAVPRLAPEAGARTPAEGVDAG